MKSQAITAKILDVRYFCSSDTKCQPTALVTMIDQNGAKRKIFLRDHQQSSVLSVGVSVILQEERSLETRFAPKYTIWEKISEYKKAMRQK